MADEVAYGGAADDRLEGEVALDIAAVVAHGLIGSMSVVVAAAHTLDRYGDVLSPLERRDVIERLVRQSDHVMGVLGDIARGWPLLMPPRRAGRPAPD